jgi:hypothetical protein
MKHTQDLSSAYGDQDHTVSWPALIRIISYSLTIGWIRALARYGTSPQTVAAYGSEPATSQTLMRLRAEIAARQ